MISPGEQPKQIRARSFTALATAPCTTFMDPSCSRAPRLLSCLIFAALVFVGVLTACGETCRDVLNDRNNCGACGHVCSPEQDCTEGVCKLARCEGGLAVCGEACRNLSNDRENCGSCGRACATNQDCANGTC